MRLKVAYQKVINGQTLHADIDTPEQCPICQNLVLLQNSVQSFTPSNNELQVLCVCPNPKCKEMIIVYYTQTGDNTFSFKKTEPPNLHPEVFPDFVRDISSTFGIVYAQAHEAKQRGLSEIAGPGFRKAAEFLLKDYAKSLSKPEDYERIEKLFVGEVVKEFIGDARIQAVAKRALWIGNDETHYLTNGAS
jgi:hypothetical protein